MKIDLSKFTSGKVKGEADVHYGYSGKSTTDGTCCGTASTLGEAVKLLGEWTDGLGNGDHPEEEHILLAPVRLSLIDVYTLEDGAKKRYAFRTFGRESDALARIYAEMDGKLVTHVSIKKSYVDINRLGEEVAGFDRWI